MSKTYYTFRIRLANDELVRVEKRDDRHELKGEPSRPFRYREQREAINSLLEPVLDNELNNSQQARQLGEILFDTIFDEVLRQEFINFYQEAVREKQQLLRIELDIDEQTMPEVAALPWEFMCLPASANLGACWLATDPNLVFSRRRSLWHSAPPIQLKNGEKLRIALAISAPKDLGHVEYEEMQEALTSLAQERPEQIELLPIINSATPTAIDNLLERKPHIFHFIGHGRMQNDAGKNAGEIALLKKFFKKEKAFWMDAESFSELFNRWIPGVVFLQSCESGMLSASQAFAGAASKIVNMNIPVVVAMQYEVSNMTASQFAYEFYQRLAKEEPVDIAAQNGRRIIALETVYRKRDFATPVIFMRVQDGYLFKRQHLSNHSKSVEIPQQQKEPLIFSTAQPNIKDLETQETITLISPSVAGTQDFEFTTVFIDDRGREIKRYQKHNQFLVEDLGNGVILEMVVIPGGEFLMSSSDSESQRFSEEKPQHSVTVQPFMMSKYPITKAQWAEIASIAEVHHKLKRRPSLVGGKNYPVTQVSWYDAVEFCDRLSQKTGREYRLPSEAEWEYACRAGTTTPFHFGETIASHLANYDGSYSYASEPIGIYRKKTNPVGDFKIANNFGLFDMHGNVWEWCLDRWHENYDGAPTNGTEWVDMDENKTRVMRGGSFINDPFKCRSSSRFYQREDEGFKHVGFRIVFPL